MFHPAVLNFSVLHSHRRGTRVAFCTAMITRPMRALLLGIVATTTACFSPSFNNGVPCSEDRLCPDGQVCAPDDRCYDPDQLPGLDGGLPQCSANETVCESDILVTCDSDGNISATESCPLGCHDTEVRCNRLEPSNGLASFLDSAAGGPEIVLTDGATIDTTTGVVTNGNGSIVDWPSTVISAPTDGVAVRVYPALSIAIGDLTVSGDSAVALVASATIEIDGRFEVAPGTGEMDLDSCWGAVLDVVSPADTKPGIGGGGFGSAGGRGGDGDGGTGLVAGAVNGNITLTPLRGGCGSFRHCTTVTGAPLICETASNPVSAPAPGGGALQLVSGQTTTVWGTIHLPGGAGSPGTLSNPGLGGGAGGGLLIEAPIIDLLPSSMLVANGGGGACDFEPGTLGQIDGSANNATCANAPDGGVGATASRPAGPGGSSADRAGGGGGGGVGRIRLNAGAIDDQSLSSPAPTTGAPLVR